jgi:nicotinate-nucleotide adenylyltransferase
VSYTVNTIKELQREHEGAGIYFVIGADTIGELPTWKDIKELTDICQFVTVARKGHSREEFDDLTGVFGEDKIAKLKAFYLDVEPVTVSATQIRQRLARGESIRGLVPEEVENYIIERGLYKK